MQPLLWIAVAQHDFELDARRGRITHLDVCAREIEAAGGVRNVFDGNTSVLENAVAAVLEGNAENDAFNRLIVDLNMAPSSAVLFRAWFRYLRQGGLTYGLTTVVDALRRAPKVASASAKAFA